jgi:hypothetical protein
MWASAKLDDRNPALAASTTADIYGHLELADLAAALQGMPNLLGGK